MREAQVVFALPVGPGSLLSSPSLAHCFSVVCEEASQDAGREPQGYI